MKVNELLDKALDFIVETQEQNDYICEQMCEEYVGDYCEKNCQNLNKECVKLFLEKVYRKEMSKAEDRYLEHFQDGRLRNCSSKEAFLLGYNQAEKDLDVVSWVKEVSGVKELSRAKEEALKAYPPQSISANYDTIDRRDAFEYGYLKAEKDLELTWEDAKEIYCIALNLRDHVGSSVFGQPFYEEILKRFKDYKERKQQ